MDDLISKRAAINVLSLGKEMLSRVLDDIDVVGTDREKYSWWLELIESYIDDIKELPSAEPEIVRCKECINHGKEICYFWSHFYGTINTPDDGFCYKAERRTNE